VEITQPKNSSRQSGTLHGEQRAGLNAASLGSGWGKEPSMTARLNCNRTLSLSEISEAVKHLARNSEKNVHYNANNWAEVSRPASKDALDRLAVGWDATGRLGKLDLRRAVVFGSLKRSE
jgi:hypothetical protein